MAGREHFYDSIFRKDPTTGFAQPLEDVAVTVDKILENGTVDPITPIPYVGRKINVAAEPMQTDENGEIDFWLDPGDYNVTFSDPLARISDLVVGFSSTPGSPNGMLRSQLPDYGRGLADSGDMKMSVLGSDHPGWLLCDGRSLATATYEALFDAIQYTYGGSGAIFNLPDLRDAGVIGPGNMGTARGDINAITADTSLGRKIGSPTATFNEDFLPAHTHAHNIGTSVSMGDAGYHGHGGATHSMNRSNPHGHAADPASGSFFLYADRNVEYGHRERIRAAAEGTNPMYVARGIGGTGQTDINHEHGITADGSHSHPLTVTPGGGVSEATAGTAAKTIDIIQPSVVVNFFIKL